MNWQSNESDTYLIPREIDITIFEQSMGFLDRNVLEIREYSTFDHNSLIDGDSTYIDAPGH
jgi:hypothetical protein